LLFSNFTKLIPKIIGHPKKQLLLHCENT
jgi:hypothetical protein